MQSFLKSMLRGLLILLGVVAVTAALVMPVLNASSEEMADVVMNTWVWSRYILGASIGSLLVRWVSEAPVPSVKILIQTLIGAVVGGILMKLLVDLALYLFEKLLGTVGVVLCGILGVGALGVLIAVLLSFSLERDYETRSLAREAIERNDNLTGGKYEQFRTGAGKALFEEELRRSSSNKKHSDYFK